MSLNASICEQARLSRDRRFDGLFFTGVLSTGIFCRPICPAPPPKPENVIYFPTAAAAAATGLRPCLRCRPEAAPGTPAWNGTSATVARGVRLIQQGALNDGGVDALATKLGVGTRHLRRLFKQHLGAPPITIAKLQRVLFGKKLLAETQLSITEIAFSSGFRSLRRFNAAFRAVYGHCPTTFRHKQHHHRAASATATEFRCTLSLSYRPPYQWHHILAFFRHRAIEGVEIVDDNAYRRSIRYNGVTGVIRVSQAPSGHALILELALSEFRHLMLVVQRVRRMFDLDANMQAVANALKRDERLRPLIQELPGLPLPGSWDPFETAIRAIVGQQITVKAARTVLSRIAAAAGPIIERSTPADPARYFPTPKELAQAHLADVGLPAKRISTIRTIAHNITAGELKLSTNKGLADFIERMVRLPGIGSWTAHYIAMRALNEPDAFPAGDLGIARALVQKGRRLTPSQIHKAAEKWRPWRAYAAMYLWNT